MRVLHPLLVGFVQPKDPIATYNGTLYGQQLGGKLF